jgi:4-hydroxy-tetrahydrodipicolinate synthase
MTSNFTFFSGRLIDQRRSASLRFMEKFLTATPSFLPHGSICALVTPFLPDDSIDWTALDRLIDRQIAAGTNALVIAGSTGESTALEVAEFQKLLAAAIQRANGKIDVIAGTGTSSTAKSIALGKIAATEGARASLVVAPAYCRPTQAGLQAHFERIADSSDIPIILYNVPARTSVDLLPETVANLHTHENICGIKEALNDMSRLAALIKLQSASFRVLSGDDPTAVEAIALGAQGLISVAANSHPTRLRNLVHLALNGQIEQARTHARALTTLFNALSVEPNPIPIKWALSCMGLCHAHLRLPLTELSSHYQAEVQNALANETLDVAEAA